MNEEKLTLAQEIAIVIRELYPDAFVAGGYLRDLDHGLEPKDLDIFTFLEPKPSALIRLDLEKDEEYHGDARINCVTGYSVFKVPVDVIHLDAGADAHDAALNFALGLQQIWMTWNEAAGDPNCVFSVPEWKIYRSNQYIWDRQHQEMTVCRCSTKPEAISIYHKIKSLQVKYPHHTIVIPKQFEYYRDILTTGADIGPS